MIRFLAAVLCAAVLASIAAAPEGVAGSLETGVFAERRAAGADALPAHYSYPHFYFYFHFHPRPHPPPPFPPACWRAPGVISCPIPGAPLVCGPADPCRYTPVAPGCWCSCGVASCPQPWRY